MAEKFGLQYIELSKAVDEIICDEETGVTTVHAYSTLPGEKDTVSKCSIYLVSFSV